METIKLNLIPTGSLPVVHTSQYDEGRVFRIELFEGSAVYTLDGTEVLECDVKKPDGNIVTIAVVNTSDNYVDVETTLQMNACAGESFGELHIKKGAKEIGTLNFILAVERSPLENGIQSDSGIHNLQTQIADAVADQYAAEDVVFDATPTAGHGVGFAVTSEGVKNALDGVAATIPEELDDLQDVTTSAPTSGEALVWDGSKWTNGMPSVELDDLGDAEITTPTAGEILEYNGAEWVNAPNPASTTNFGAPYDENTTYNVPSLVIYNNLLYTLNDGEDGTTGPWDPTKWTQTSVAELAELIGSLSTLTTTDKSSLVGAVNEVDGDIANLPSEIRCGVGNYSGLKGGGHANRVNVPITFSTPMTGTQYAVFIVVSDAYSDYPYIQGYCFSGSRTANGFTATILSMSTDTVTENSGSFYWVAVRYK